MAFWELCLAFGGTLTLCEVREWWSTHSGLKTSEEPSKVTNYIIRLNTLGRFLSWLFDLLMVFIVVWAVTKFSNSPIAQIGEALVLFIPGIILVNVAYTTIVKRSMDKYLAELEREVKIQQQVRGDE